MHVIATAGHVDHGKSALVRALTGIEPDRWDEERRRGLTIDLGYAWTTLPSGEQVAFVDVPGHQRFIGNMLAGVGPTSAVLFVVAADEGWRRQSQEHLAAVDALGISHGLLVVTRSDLADPAPALLDARDRLSATSLGDVESVAVSARTGAGMTELTDALVRLVVRLPPARPGDRVRLWVDRAFSIRGSGTVVTGTLSRGGISIGDELQVGNRRARVRGLESLGQPRDRVLPVARVAVNLRGVAVSDVARGDLLLTPDAWRMTSVLDVRMGGQSSGDLPNHLTLHAGTAAVAVHVRPLGDDTVRLTLSMPLPLVAGDRLILRDAGAQRIIGGALVLDADPPELRRRGAAARRGAELASATGVPELLSEVERRGAMLVADAAALGIPDSSDDAKVLKRGTWLVSGSALHRWADALIACVQQQAAAEPLEPSLTTEAARLAAGVPDRTLLPDVVERAGLELHQGRVWLPGVRAAMGAAERGLQELEARLQQAPFAAPEQPDLAAAGLGPREVAAAVRSGRLLRLSDGVLLAPDAPAKAMRVLAGLAQPFTLSEARQALDTTRRVAVPLLEHLDGRGWTRRVDGTHRVVVR
ncbi:selenocysteine-specific translation elongation factor [Phycicoccus sp. Root101]|uniref:selenocysteine-specific translation elongation factor n=1 Tax=Phycicoccus sp. Root101 TaxID=1736421 RepID=UPI00070347AB|nr:selenocysteine-specific translation elongation factor [Phycicoccus sp. Root101]KQU70164.1 translation elongation factor [Phycicoccus sp. Root101]